LPIHKIKIDQSFVRDINKSDDAKDIIRCIVGMAKGLRLDTIAEGIEDQDQKNFLKDLEVNEGQGYLFSKPISAAELEEKYL
jgi:EAL domain-containing protein (putative c-di-GMP-specific phosphodiesterase class I)